LVSVLNDPDFHGTMNYLKWIIWKLADLWIVRHIISQEEIACNADARDVKLPINFP
jgi:hypothetical protein